MLIIAGNKRTRVRQGYVADFCPLCRDVREFAVWRSARVFHLYWAAIGEGESLGFEVVCQTCHHRWPTDTCDYAAISEKRVADLATLERLTFPDLRSARGERLATERVLRAQPHRLAPEVRSELLREPFQALAPILRARAGGMHLDAVGVSVALSVAALLTALGVAVSLVTDEAARFAIAGVFLLVGLSGGLITIRAIDAEPRRWYRRRLIARVARWLRPLRPNHGEIEPVVAHLRREGVLAAHLTDVELLLDLVHKPEDIDRLDPLPDPTTDVPTERQEQDDPPLPPLAPRIAQLRECILGHAQVLHDRGQRTHLDLTSLLWAALTILAVAACLVAVASAKGDAARTPFVIGTVLAGAFGGLYTIRLIDQEPHRWFRRRLLPRVARSLLPLRPNRLELEQVVERLRDERTPIGQLVSARRLAELLQHLEGTDRPAPPRSGADDRDA